MADPETPESWREGRLLSVGDRGQYVLLEMPHGVFVDLRPTVERLRAGRSADHPGPSGAEPGVPGGSGAARGVHPGRLSGAGFLGQRDRSAGPGHGEGADRLVPPRSWPTCSARTATRRAGVSPRMAAAYQRIHRVGRPRGRRSGLQHQRHGRLAGTAACESRPPNRGRSAGCRALMVSGVHAPPHGRLAVAVVLKYFDRISSSTY